MNSLKQSFKSVLVENVTNSKNHTNSTNSTNQINPTNSTDITFDATNRDFALWADFFYANGYIKIANAINSDQLMKLKADLYKLNNTIRQNATKSTNRHFVHKRFFENSKTTVDLVESSVMTDFAKYLIADVPGGRGNTLSAHLIHNNAFTINPGGRGQAPTYHTDDCLQNVIIPDGKKLPNWIRLPVLTATWMCWLSDCNTSYNGPTYVVPGSHRWGRIVNQTEAEELGIPMCGMAGTAVLVNNQTWHRGCENTSNIPRDTLQLTYARRIIGHKFGTIMNYQMPPHVLAKKSMKTRELFGFLEGGAYS